MQPFIDAASPARRLLRSHFFGELLLADRTARLSYIRHPARCALIAPIERWMLEEAEATFAVPDSTAASMQLHVTLAELDPRTDPICDRWLAYHLAPVHRTWCELRIIGGKVRSRVLNPASDHDVVVFDADDLSTINERTAQEPSLCKLANSDRPGLRRACEAAMKQELPDALCVGVDLAGIDLRTAFGPIRLDVHSTPTVEFLLPDYTILTPESGPEVIAAIEAARHQR